EASESPALAPPVPASGTASALVLDAGGATEPPSPSVQATKSKDKKRSESVARAVLVMAFSGDEAEGSPGQLARALRLFIDASRDRVSWARTILFGATTAED